MLKFLETLKEQHKDDESLIAINEIEKELTNKKYGLVWEEHEEEVDKMMETHIPVFTEDKDKEIIGNPDSDDCNFLLEGDNLHSLKLLEKTHKGKIDVIYIDPPYNTGNKDFIYEDDYVKSEDSYKHSMWISFMYKRLKIARVLLSEKGVIFISIDDNEMANLKKICDEIFDEKNFLCSFVRKTKSMTGDDGNGLNIQFEYLLAYSKNKTKVQLNGEEKDLSNYKNPDDDINGPWCAADPSAKSGGESTYFPIKNPYTGKIDYPPKGRYWAFSEKTLEDYIETGRVKFKKEYPEGQRGFIFKRYKNNLTSTRNVVGTLSFIENDYMNQNATKELNNIIGAGKFSYPKPVVYIKKIIEYSSDKNSIILDFFAGSATTAHAVMQLNNEDNGNRKYILCTNNENNICESITYERIKTVITGKRGNHSEFSDGMHENIKYYKTEFIDKDDDNLIEKILEHIVEMIQLEYGMQIDNKKYVLIMDDDEMDEFECNINSYDDLKAVFINQDVMLSTSQEKLLNDINTYTIPDHYFDFELREAGEIW